MTDRIPPSGSSDPNVQQAMAQKLAKDLGKVAQEAKQAASTDATQSSTGYGATQGLGDVQMVIEMLIEVLTPIAMQLYAESTVTTKVVSLISGDLTSLATTFQEACEDPEGSTFQAFYDSYQSLAQLASVGFLEQKVSVVGDKLGKSSSWDQQVAEKLSTKTQSLLDKVNAALTPADSLNQPDGAPLNSDIVTLLNESYTSALSGLTQIFVSLQGGAEYPERYPTNAQAYQSITNALNGLMISVPNDIAKTSMADMGLDQSQLSSAVTFANVVLKLLARSYKSEEGNMPGSGGG